jgi:hypothetical protein
LRASLKHDPEKWKPVFGKDHAQTMSQSEMAIQPKTISLQPTRRLNPPPKPADTRFDFCSD